MDHIKPIAYGKIILCNLVDDSRVLYLDSDVIVDNDISELFDLNMDGHPVAAVEDLTDIEGHFNTGVVLYDMERIHKAKDLVKEELKLGENRNLRNADQDVMNSYFKDDYKRLPLKYNYQIGADIYSFYGHYWRYFKEIDRVGHPEIIHYLTWDKPWNTVSSSRLRQKWWEYYDLTFSEAAEHKRQPKTIPSFKTRFFTFTSTDNCGNLPKLIRALPNCQFNIASWTAVSDRVIRLLDYGNVRIYQYIIGQQLEKLTANCDAYLDVNYGEKESQAITPFMKRNAPIYSFEEVADDSANYQNYHIFSNNDVSGVVTELRRLLRN